MPAGDFASMENQSGLAFNSSPSLEIHRSSGALPSPAVNIRSFIILPRFAYAELAPFTQQNGKEKRSRQCKDTKLRAAG